MNHSMRIAVTGASGLVGTALIPYLRGQGHGVLRLVRRSATQADEVSWEPRTGQVDLPALQGVDAVIHLAGAGVGDHRWTPAYKQEILQSRLYGTQTIAKAVATLQPRVFLSASAIGWYGDTGQRIVTEVDDHGSDFLADVCRQWEAATQAAAGVRTVKLRTGIVLSAQGGALGRMLPLFRAGLGGRLGDGRQYWSWISLVDTLAAIDFCLQNDVAGPVNLTAPEPETNAAFTQTLAHWLHRPAVLPVPAVALRLALGEFSCEVLGSKRVLPAVLQRAGFSFQHSSLAQALANIQ